MNNEQLLISIIIPCHNILNYIDRALNSCLSQTHKNIEVILIENGSTDDSWNYCQMLAKKYPNIVFAYQSNPYHFSGGARNLGIEKARGDYLAFLDDDDMFYPHALTNLLDYCLKYDLEIAIGSVNIISPPSKPRVLTGKRSGIFLNDSRLDLTSATTSCKLYKTSLIKECNIRFDITRIAQDNMFYAFSKLLAKKIGVLSFLLEPIYAYQIHHDSSTVQAVDEHYKCIVDFAMNMISEFDNIVNNDEKKRRILGDYYGTDLEQPILAKACFTITNFLPLLMNYYIQRLSTEGRNNIDKYLKENDIFAKVTAFEQKYKAQKSQKLYYCQRLKKHGTIKKAILKVLRFSIKLFTKIDNQIAAI